jgi:hypothetical protein
VVLLLLGHHQHRNGLPGTWVGLTESARDLLSWPEEQVWDWWDGPEAEAARGWRDRDGTGEAVADLVRAGLGPAELEQLTGPAGSGGGLSREQAVAWCEAVGAAGSTAVAGVREWRAAGLPADPPVRFASLLHQVTPEELAGWFGAGFELDDVAALVGLPLEVAVRWRAAGFGADEVSRLLRADHTLTPAEAARFDAAGIPPDDRVRWVAAGFDAGAARAWTDLDILPDEARVWRSLGRGPADARPLRAGGPLPPGIRLGWTATGAGARADRSYGVTDPPGTRGHRAARERRRFSAG